MMERAIQLVRESLLDAAHQLRPVALFLVGWGLMYAVVLAPLTTWALGRLVTTSGNWAVSNEDIATFLLSPAGIVFLGLAGTLNVAFFYSQQAGLLMIANAKHLGSAPGLLGLLWQNLKRIPLLAKLATLQIGAFALLFLPFGMVVAVVALRLLGDHDINYYLATKPSSWTWAVRVAVAALGAYALLGAWLFLRWLLAVPYVVHSDAGPFQCLRQSWRATRGRLRLLALPLLLWWAAWLAVSLSLSALYVVVARELVDWGIAHGWWLGLMLMLLQSVALIGGVLGTFVGGVVHQFLVANLYWQLHPPIASAPVSATPQPLLPRRVLVGFALALILSTASIWSETRSLETGIEVAITAHRGSSRHAPENTLSAIRQAIAEKADYAEIDVQSTKDGETVMLHDGDLMRLAGDPRQVMELTLPELKQIDIGSWFATEFKEERPATLQEVIALARDRIKLNIELKYNRPDPELADRVLAILHAESFVTNCVVTSLAAGELIRLKENAPELRVGLIVTEALGDYTRLPVDFVSLNAAQANASSVAAARRHGKAVHVWTINDLDAALRMMAYGVDNLITDEPAALVKLRQQVRELNAAELLALGWSARFIL